MAGHGCLALKNNSGLISSNVLRVCEVIKGNLGEGGTPLEPATRCGYNFIFVLICIFLCLKTNVSKNLLLIFFQFHL
jgi:hypothetical protein